MERCACSSKATFYGEGAGMRGLARCKSVHRQLVPMAIPGRGHRCPLSGGLQSKDLQHGGEARQGGPPPVLKQPD